MKKILASFFALLLLCSNALALELVRQKNVATYVTFPVVDADGDTITSASGLDSEIDIWADGSAPNGFADCTNEATEIGATGIYYLSLTQSEMNNDYIYLQIKTTSTGGKTQHILIRTIIGDPLNIATTQSGRELDVTATGAAGVDFGNIEGTLDAAEIGSDAITSAKIATDAIGSNQLAQAAADKVWSTTTRALTDKANFTLASGEYTNIWNKDVSAYSGNGYAGTYLKNLWDKKPSGNFLSDGVWDATKASYLDAAVSSRSTLTAANVWQTDISSYSTAGQAGTYLKGAGSGADPWATALPGSYGAGTAGYIIGNNLNATVSSRSSHSAADVWAIGTRTITGGTISTNNDKTGYSLSQSFPTNFASMAITAGGAVTVGTNNDKTGYTASTVQDKTGYSLTQSFPSNFSALAITGGGAVTAGTVSDKTGYSLSASGVDAVWDELTTGHTTTGSYGKLLTDNIDATISSRSTFSGGAVASVTGNVGGTINGLTATAKTDVENAVWDATASSHNTAGTMGNKLNSAASAGDPWNTALPGSYGAGTAGYVLGTNLNATVSSRSTLTAANVWQTDLSGYSTANQAGTLLKGAGSAGDPWSTAIPGSYGAGTAGYIVGNNLNATVSSRSTHSASDVWAVGTRTITGGTVTSVTNGVTVATNNDKTAYSLTQAFPSNFSALSIDTSGRMDLGKWVGNAPNALISGRVDSNAQVVGDKSGYSLSQSFPSNFSSLAITAGGAVTVGTNNDKTGYGLTSAGEDSIVNKVWDEPRSGHTTAGSFGQGVASVQGNVTGSVNSVTGAVTVGTNNDKTGYSLTQSFPSNFSSLAITAGGAVTVGTNNDKTGYALTSAEEDAIVDKVWNELRSGHTTAGSFGQGVASVQGNVTGSVNSVTSAVTVGTNNDKTGYGLSTASIDDIWNESQSGHSTAGTFGYFLDSRVSDAGGSLTAADVADAVWDETAADHSATGTTGKKLLDASLAGDPWATNLPGSYSGSQAGFYLQDLIKKSRGR